MLTILHPEILPLIHDVPAGLIPVQFEGENYITLIVKTAKEAILASKINCGFKIYVAPLKLESHETLGLISAFFDDEDEPLVILTPLFEGPDTQHYLNLLLSKKFHVYFFDENTKEYLGYSASINCNRGQKSRLESSSFVPLNLMYARKSHDQMSVWFGNRTIKDDKAAISVLFDEPLFPEDIVILDTIPENNSYHGSKTSSITKLDRKEPGSYQERDIVTLLHRIFSPDQIYINPLKITDKEEIVDILVVTKENILLIQAKDSPNLESIIKNKISRKKSTAEKSLKKAINQMKGALRYISSSSKMIIKDQEYELEIGNKKLRSLVITKELFNDQYSTYSSIILPLVKSSGVPCIALDYPEFNKYTSVLPDELSLFKAFDTVSDYGVENGAFPRLRIWPDELK